MVTSYVLDIATPLTMVLAETTGTETIAYLHGLDLVAQSDGTTTEYFAYDGLGSVRQVADDAGEALLSQTYDPYGNLYARAGADVTSYGFTGEQTDSSGLLYLRARYYAPSQGRFFQPDPSRQEMNPYQYASSNPILFIDLTGLYADPVYQDNPPTSVPYTKINDPTTGGYWTSSKKYLEFAPTNFITPAHDQFETARLGMDQGLQS